MTRHGLGGTAHRPGKLTPMERLLQHVSMIAVGLSGILFAWMKYGMEASDDPFTVVNHPAQPYLLGLHVLAAPLWILAVGLILREHVIARLRDPRRRRGRRSGAWSAALLLPMVVSGYLLQVVTGETGHRALVWLHIVSGSAYLVLFLVHVVVARLAAGRLLEEATLDRGAGLEAAGFHLRVRTRPPSSEAPSWPSGIRPAASPPGLSPGDPRP